MLSKIVLLSLVLAFAAVRGGAEGPKKIQDNSFLLEEAYNQEAGVVQHIQTFQQMNDSSWIYTYTDEWPVAGQAHQLSVTVPAQHLAVPGSETGVSDLMLNYRYQLVFKEQEGIACSPRLSILLPTGNYTKGLGTGSAGVQANLPLSVELSDRWVTHWNVGATYEPANREPAGAMAATMSFNYGMSIIWLATENINLLLENAGNSNEMVQPGGMVQRADSFFMNAGARFAINFKSGLQVVPGFAVPIGIGSSKGQQGIYLYLSFEHPMF